MSVLLLRMWPLIALSSAEFDDSEAAYSREMVACRRFTIGLRSRFLLASL